MARILLAEDNALNRGMLTRRLERSGHDVVTAVNGKEALDSAASDRPDLILMDLSMPVMDGWQATRELKASARTREIPVIALTAHAMVGDREKAMAAGCDSFETKPIEYARLLANIGRLLKPELPAATQAAPPTAAAGHSILVVDDNHANRDLLSRRLERQQYRVTWVGSGPEAVERINAEPFDLVLLDVMMPGMNGLEVLTAIRTRFSILDLPVIMVTAKDQSEDTVTALQLGANDYATKPLDFPVVLARIKTQLAIRDAHQTSRGKPVAAAVAIPARPAARPAPARPAVAARNSYTPRAPAGGGTAVAARPARVGQPPKDRPPAGTIPPSDQMTWVDGNTAPDLPNLVGYEILSELGRGGMGVVYKARDLRMNRPVALKVIDKQHLANAHAIERFYREIRAAAQLAHPNIVLAYDASRVGETHYFAMEYVEGIDLSQLVKRDGPLPVEMACSYVRQAARGLQHAYERGMVHRDIKPSNLLVTWAPPPPGQDAGTTTLGRPAIKILDMGLALLHQPTESADGGLTRDGRVVGTADYMAPEQWTNPHKVDIRADLYSLGCTFYFLVTGAVPFPGDEPMEKMLKHHLDEPTPAEKLRPEVPANVAAVIRKLLAKKPADRFQRPADLAEALR